MFEITPDGGPSRPVSPPLPKKTPAPTGDTSPAKAWADAVAQAKANSPQQTVTVKPGDSLASIAESHGDTLSSVEQADPQVQPPWLLHYPGTVFLPKKTPAEVVNGVDNADVKPIITAMAHANAANQGPKGPAWNTVKQTTYNMLVNDNAGASPEQKAAAEVKQLNALEPGNAKFAAANNAALAEATKQWQQMGVTKPQLSPIINAYSKYKQATTPAAVQQAQNQLSAAIEKSLVDAANLAGANPQARAQAMTDRAANIQLAGPQDPVFQTAVDKANYDLQVTKPAQQVANAYATALAKARANGDYPNDAATSAALAAANELKTVTQNAGNPYYAGQIIQASQGTINSITKAMGSYAAESFHSPGTVLEFNQIYGDLSQSVAAANKITLPPNSNGQVSIPLSAGGKAAADMMANDIVKNLPKNLTLDNYSIYNEAAIYTIGQGEGAALTLATAAALKQHGQPELAAFMTVGAARGLDRLASKTKSDITAFATTTANLNQLRSTWGPFMTESQLVTATNGYLADNKDVTQKANAELGTISQDGDAIVEAEAAWHSYGAQLKGVEGQGELATAAKALTGKNPSTSFAVSQSKTLNEAIAAAMGPAEPSGGGGSVMQALLASPAWSLPKSTRSFVNALFKTHVAQAKSTGAKPVVGQGTFTTLSLIGLGLTAEAAWANGFSASSPEKLATSAYTALGFGKYTGEVISGFAKTNIVQDFVKNNSAFTVNSGKLFLNLPNGSQFELTSLTKTGWFKALGSAYYGAGALASVLEASDAFSNGDNVAGGFDIAEGVGNGLNAIKPLIEEAFGDVAGEAVGAVGSGIGVLAVVGQLFYNVIKSADDQQAFQQDGIKFLQQGLGLNYDLAQELTWPGGQSTSASNALQAYANKYGIPVKQILSKLNQEPADKAILFVDEAAGVPTQSNGRPVVSQRGDGPGQVGYHKFTASDKGHTYYTAEIPNQADSLVQLHDWADYLFGNNQIG